MRGRLPRHKRRKLRPKRCLRNESGTPESQIRSASFPRTVKPLINERVAWIAPPLDIPISGVRQNHLTTSVLFPRQWMDQMLLHRPYVQMAALSCSAGAVRPSSDRYLQGQKVHKGRTWVEEPRSTARTSYESIFSSVKTNGRPIRTTTTCGRDTMTKR